MATLARTYWEDTNKRRHRMFVVLVYDHDGYGNALFGILNVYTNSFERTGYGTREDAYADLNSIEC